ncbi:class D sortase [Fredinandcohnia quinoae]|uniref:Class D sortase n=1 Tax=Fredinandcohnia quinoae TaxID=2918902 RepID=A0AAW5E0H2_9BACI|nr:class D sortase [Fredinandcohnia sp. SECRCQ15]MCH1625079.1 class D sortase [Fredinandcohnia sp. SECRCQ15]
MGYTFFQMWKIENLEGKALVQAEELVGRPRKDSLTQTIDVPIFKKGDAVGVLEVPKLNVKLPIVEGTDEAELRKGVGHFIGTGYPTQNDQIVLSGHRETVFKRLGELTIGDIFIMKMQYGDFTYKIEDIKIVHANDRTIIVPTFPKEVLTVTTCYPFRYIGNAPKRYIIMAKRVND